MKHCTVCGAELTDRLLEKEGRMVPYCPECGEFRFPLFNVCCSMICMNRALDRIVLIKQYGVKEHILVAGYVNCGENAENTVVREVKEELGLAVTALKFNKSEYFAKTNTLMLNYGVVVDSMNLEGLARDEVDLAEWFTFEEAEKHIMKDSLAAAFLHYHLEHFAEKWPEKFENHDQPPLVTQIWDN